MMSRMIAGAIALVCVLVAGCLGFVWFFCRLYVPPDECAVLIRRMGADLPPGQLVATEPGQKGIQEAVLGPGRYFRNPIVWSWELHKLKTVQSGDPGTWEWVHSLDANQQNELRAGTFRFKGDFPKIGLVTRKVGKEAPPGQVTVTRASGYKGILREFLTPGTYRINPYVYDVQEASAVVIPAGFVGVVTNMFGDQASAGAAATTPAVPPEDTPLPEAAATVAAAGEDPVEAIAEAGSVLVSKVRPLAQPGERGTLHDVLQPGVYFINPKLQRITLVEIGFNEYSQLGAAEGHNYQIAFPSDTGFNIRVGVTVVWGIDPHNAAQIINTYGNTDGVLDKIIGPQLRSICRNIGSTYAARDFIHGAKREEFQRALTAELQRVCHAKNIEILLALVREIEVYAPAGGPEGGDVTEDLKRTIQQSYIAIEKQLTKEKQREAAMVKAELEQVRKEVDIAREQVAAESRVMVTNVMEEGRKQAAQTEAQAALEVAEIQEQVAQLDAQRTEILGQAAADVEKMKKDAEAQGYEMLISAFGSPQAYNLYTFAQGFEPESIRLFFAGDGTFWTDLTHFEDAGAAKLLQGSTTGGR